MWFAQCFIIEINCQKPLFIKKNYVIVDLRGADSALFKYGERAKQVGKKYNFGKFCLKLTIQLTIYTTRKVEA